MAGLGRPGPRYAAPFRVVESRRDAEEVSMGSPTSSRRSGLVRSRSGPRDVAPQLATLSADAPAGGDWVHEIKYDGYRILALADGDDVQLLSRNGKDWTARFQPVADALAALALSDSVLDGEIAVELEDGRTSFQALQNLLAGQRAGSRLVFWIFDLLRVAGEDLRRRPLLERKDKLDRLLRDSRPPLRYSDHVTGHGPAFLARACEHGLEGIISKRSDAPYRAGRGTDWLKVKCVREQEFVVGGYTAPGGSRSGLGALHVGTFEDGRLVYRGKVGTGFSDATLRLLHRRLRPLERAQPPFADAPTGAAVRGTRWVEPELVAQVRYTEITADGRLRHPAFRGLREDRSAASVRLESTRVSQRMGPPDGAENAHEGEPAKRSTDNGKASPPSALSRRVRSRAAAVSGVRLTSPGKVLYPEQGVTKRELADYYERVSEWMLPHIAARPLTLVRCPAGHDKHCFYQKHFDDSAPAPIRRIRIEERDGPEWYGVLDSAEGLVALVQLGTLELHTWNSRRDRLERPDRFIIDLDPDPGVAWEAVVDAALHVREALEWLGLESFLKTTGGKGLHVAVPLVRRAEWPEVKEFSKAVASLLARAAPELYTLEMSKRKRRGRILLDYLRNARGATAVEAYSSRARAGAPVAAPIHWDELFDGVRADTFTVRNMVARLRELGEDPWKEFGAVKQSLTAPMKRSLGL
jgi:bifunctional non-homologous end joining protein LigD